MRKIFWLIILLGTCQDSRTKFSESVSDIFLFFHVISKKDAQKIWCISSPNLVWHKHTPSHPLKCDRQRRKRNWVKFLSRKVISRRITQFARNAIANYDLLISNSIMPWTVRGPHKWRKIFLSIFYSSPPNVTRCKIIFGPLPLPGVNYIIKKNSVTPY